MYKHISIKPICVGWSQTSNPSCYCCLLHLRGYALALAKEYTGQLLQIYIYMYIRSPGSDQRFMVFLLVLLGLEEVDFNAHGHDAPYCSGDQEDT